MSELEQRDIVLVKFPFSDFILTKIRPAIIISNNEYNHDSDDVLIIGLTSKHPKEGMLLLSEEELQEGNLKLKTYVRHDKIHLTDKNGVIKKIGKIKSIYYKKIVLKITELIKEGNKKN